MNQDQPLKSLLFHRALNENLFDMDKDTYFDKGYEICFMVQELNHGKKVGMDFKLLEKFYKILPIQDL